MPSGTHSRVRMTRLEVCDNEISIMRTIVAHPYHMKSASLTSFASASQLVWCRLRSPIWRRRRWLRAGRLTAGAGSRKGLCELKLPFCAMRWCCVVDLELLKLFRVLQPTNGRNITVQARASCGSHSCKGIACESVLLQ